MKPKALSLLCGAMIAALFSTQPAQAGPNPYIGELMIVGQTWCPRGWAPANGALLQIAQHQALFSIIGTTYGGDGRHSFALPDLRSRVPVGSGQGTGLAPVRQGERGGADSHALSIGEMPNHSHAATSSAASDLRATGTTADSDQPGGNAIAELARGQAYSSTGPLDAAMRAGSVVTNVTTEISAMGGSQPFDIRQPYLGLQFCIALQGVYPPRN